MLKRRLLGLIALAMLATAAVLSFGVASASVLPLAGTLWRCGALLAVFWLAYEQIARLPQWLLLVFPPLLLVIVVRPRWLFWIGPLILLLLVLGPGLRSLFKAAGDDRR